MNEKITRRGFLATAAAAAMAAPALGAAEAKKAAKAKGGKGKGRKKAASPDAATIKRAVGANSRIRIGLIGVGGRGYGAHMPGIHDQLGKVDHDVVAVADPWRLHRERAAVRAKEWYGTDIKQFVSYRELLEMKDLDAVMIASPDHLHTMHLDAAAKAGKHVYCEKPMGNEIDKVVRAFDAAKASGKVIQIGTQLRSLPAAVGMRDLYKSGILGKVSRIEECRNSEKPYWYGHLDEIAEVKEADVDWKEFLGDKPMRPFDARQFGGWYGYYEFSQGPVPQWGAHYLDLMHFVTGCGFPETCVCLGGTFIWKDEYQFTAPDQVQAMWTYPDGFMMSYSTNFGNGFGNVRRIYGDKGVIKFDNWSSPTYSAEGGPKRDGKIRGENEVKPVENPDHFLNWLQCMVKNDKNVAAPPEAGLQHSVATIMAVMSYDKGRRTRWDAEKRIIVMD